MGIIRWFVGLLVRLWVLFMLGTLAWAWRLRSEVVETTDPAADDIDLVGVFGGHEFASTAGSFRGGRLSAAFGGGILDLRDATPDPAGVHLELRSVFGGYQIVVPETWRVDVQSVTFAGGVGDLRDRATVDPEGPTLTLSGFSLFGGAGIVSERRDADSFAGAMAEQ